MKALLKVGLLLFGITLVAIGIRQVQTDHFYNDVQKIEGHYDGIRKKSLKKGREEFKVSLQGDNSEYTIQSYMRRSFDYESFVKEVQIGELINIYINELGSKMISQIKCDGKNYVSIEERNRRRKTNGIFGLIGGLIFIIMGIKTKT